MTTAAITFPASVVPAGYTVTFDVPKFLQPESIIGVQGTSVPGTATENGRTYHFWFQRHTDGEVFNFGLSCNGQPIRNPAHKVALRAVILAAYRYATRAAELGEQHDAHVERMGWAEHVESMRDDARAALNLPEIIPNAPAFVSIDGEAPISWAEFMAANADGLDDVDLAAIRCDLAACGIHHGGGGATDEYTIKAVPAPEPTQPLAPLYTLARLHQRDFPALWASIPPEKQAEIGAMVLRQECANQVALDGGFNTTADDRGEADAISNEILNTLPRVIERAIPDELPVLYDDPYPLWMILGDRPSDRTPSRIPVRGLPTRRRPVHNEVGWHVRANGGLVELGGAINIGSRDPDADPVWEYVTAADIEAERRRRHPEQFASA